MAEPAGADHRLRPWWIGLSIIVVTDAVAAYLFFAQGCTAGAASGVSTLLFVLVFLVLPVIYLTLMAMALKSQP